MRRPPSPVPTAHRVHIQSLVVEGLPLHPRHGDWLHDALCARLADAIGTQRPSIASGDRLRLDAISLDPGHAGGSALNAVADRLGDAITKGTGRP